MMQAAVDRGYNLIIGEARQVGSQAFIGAVAPQ